jgi:hypothetical protein
VGGYYLITKLFSQFGAGAADPGGGAKSTGVIDGILNQTAEIGKSSLNYTEALTKTVTDFPSTVNSILDTNALSQDANGTQYSFGHDALWYATFGLFGNSTPQKSLSGSTPVIQPPLAPDTETYPDYSGVTP